MPRLQLTLPEQFAFRTSLPVRITDINYGGHVGNDSILSMIHELRMRYLRHLGYNNELDVAGSALIMSDVAIVYKSESFYGDVLTAEVTPSDLHKYGFDLCYRLSNQATGKVKVVAEAKTGMLTFDYSARKIMVLPEAFRLQIETKTG